MRGRSRLQNVALLAGVVFLGVGILGFIPGITTHYDDLELSGRGSGARLLGTFQVSILGNLVHLLLGAVGLGLARTIDGARRFLAGGGGAQSFPHQFVHQYIGHEMPRRDALAGFVA